MRIYWNGVQCCCDKVFLTNDACQKNLYTAYNFGIHSSSKHYTVQVQLFSNMIMEVLISAHTSSLPVRKYTTICTCTTSKNNIVYRIAASTIPVSAYTSGFYPLSTLYDGSLIAAYMYRPSGNLLKLFLYGIHTFMYPNFE